MLPVPCKIGGICNSTFQPARIDLLHLQSIECPSKIGCQAKARCTPLSSCDRRELQQPFQRIDGRRKRIFDPVERATYPLVEFWIADRDEPRKQQSTAARADESIGHCTDS